MNSQDGGILLSSRIRLARNLKKYPFPNRLTWEESQAQLAEIVDMVHHQKGFENFRMDILRDMDAVERKKRVEKHLMSMELLNHYENSAIIVDPSEEVSIMINEEDHIRIQCIKPGLDLREAYKRASEIDDMIEDRFEYAFNERLGYLTSCLTNIGTGMRASVMMHLPGITALGEEKNLIDTVSKVGFAVRGVYGEGTDYLGDIFQVSNQITLGFNEIEVIEAVENMVLKIIEKEKSAREQLLKRDRMLVEDKIYRSYGLLKNARMMNYKESMKLLSDILLGIDLGIINHIERDKVRNLMDNIQPAALQIFYGENMNARERVIRRAKVIREFL
ncbi:MAG: protein arginine kinase [Peptostreptococcales bacterium]